MFVGFIKHFTHDSIFCDIEKNLLVKRIRYRMQIMYYRKYYVTVLQYAKTWITLHRTHYRNMHNFLAKFYRRLWCYFVRSIKLNSSVRLSRENTRGKKPVSVFHLSRRSEFHQNMYMPNRKTIWVQWNITIITVGLVF